MALRPVLQYWPQIEFNDWQEEAMDPTWPRLYPPQLLHIGIRRNTSPHFIGIRRNTGSHFISEKCWNIQHFVVVKFLTPHIPVACIGEGLYLVCSNWNSIWKRQEQALFVLLVHHFVTHKSTKNQPSLFLLVHHLHGCSIKVKHSLLLLVHHLVTVPRTSYLCFLLVQRTWLQYQVKALFLLLLVQHLVTVSSESTLCFY